MVDCRICHLSCEIDFVFQIHRIFKLLSKYSHLSTAIDEESVKMFNCAKKNELDNMCCSNMEV